jgi:hypothetical protein
VATLPIPILRREALVSADQMLDTTALKRDSNRAFASGEKTTINIWNLEKNKYIKCEEIHIARQQHHWFCSV